MAETEGISRSLLQPILPEATTAVGQIETGDVRTEMARLRQTVGSDIQGIREYLSRQQDMLRDMYHTLSQQINELLVLTRINFATSDLTVSINSTSPILLTEFTAHTTPDSQVLCFCLCEMVLSSTTNSHNLLFEIYKDSIGGTLIGVTQMVDNTLAFNQWGNVTRAIDDSPDLEQTYFFTGKKVAADDADTNVFAIIAFGLNSQKAGAS